MKVKKPTTPDVKFCLTHKIGGVVGMDIMPFILNFLKSFFPFSEMEGFYLKDISILIQGILSIHK